MPPMAASNWCSPAAACWAGLLLSLTLCSSEPPSSVLEAHRQTLLDSAQQLENAAAPTQYFSKDFPHGSVGETRLEQHDDLDYDVYHNLWYHSSRFYGIHDAETLRNNKSSISVSISKNLGIVTIAAVDAAAHYRNTQAVWLGGTTVLIDQPYPSFPDNMGHWAEVLVPLYNLLTSAPWRRSHTHVDTILFGNLQRSQLDKVDWVWEMLKLVFAPVTLPGQDLPRTIFYDDFVQVDRREWLCIQEAIVIHDRYTHPEALPGFRTPELGRQFREAAYARHGIKMPSQTPQTITVLTNVGAEQVTNLDDFVEVMDDVGRAFGYRTRLLSMTLGAAFSSFVAAMSRTGVLVSRHGPHLANVMLLPPGASVVELLPYNWQWAGICELYRNMSRSVGDIHHVAWRANSMQWAAYASPNDEIYGSWTAAECGSNYCLEAHARAGMIVDSATVAELTMHTLKSVRDSPSAPDLRPWPDMMLGGKPALWWQR